MTLRLTDDEQRALRVRADLEGISMQEAARRAVREFIARGAHRDRVEAAAGAHCRRACRGARPSRPVSSPIEYLDVEDLLRLAVLLLDEPPPVRDLGLLAAAAARPSASAFGADAYPDLWSKAAALLQSVVKNHALIDGNKRLTWLATAVFLEINDADARQVSNDAVYELVILAASTAIEVEDLAARLHDLVMS